MKDHIKKLRDELKQLNGLQWARKRQLKDAIHRDSRRSISRLTKDLNRRKVDIRVKASLIEQIKMSRSKAAYFQGDKVESIFGIHASGFEGPNGEFYQEDIWANTYYLIDGKYRFRGGSMRVHGNFDDVVQEMVQDGHVKVDVREDQFE